MPDTDNFPPSGANTAKALVGVADGVQSDVRMYDPLLLEAQSGAGGKDFIEGLNPDSLKTVTAIVEPSLAHTQGRQVPVRAKDHQPDKPVFNLAMELEKS